MAEVRRRRTRSGGTSKPVSRRRDRARDEEEDEDEEETTPRRRRSSSSTTTKRRREREPVDEDEEEDDDLDDEEEDDDEDEEPRSRRRSSTKSSSRSSSRSRSRSRDDEDDERPRRSSRSSSRSRGRSTKKAPAAVRSGSAGVDEVREMAGSGLPRIKLQKAPVLVKLLDDYGPSGAPMASYLQHWVNPGGGARSDRPYTCIGKGCPLCEMGARKSQTIVLNALQLSGVEEPTLKVIQTGIRGWNNLKDAAEDKKGKVMVSNGYWAVNVSGKGTDAQTNFRPVKDRDLEDDWEEIFENFEYDDLADIIEDAKEELFEPSIIQVSSKSELRQLARHLADEEDDDDDDEDDDD